jgi:bifunctional UDP-N-acetylglucosamine pyrophosphorylase/glucosamine-1-phosphate N-acetyltransferase
MTYRSLSAIVLAAGQGTRMRSSRPKPLHLLAGRAMLLYVLDALATSEVERVVVVVGHGAERVTKKLQAEEPDLQLAFVEQHQQNGTGDAASVGLTGLPDEDGPDADDGRPPSLHW